VNEAHPPPGIEAGDRSRHRAGTSVRELRRDRRSSPRRIEWPRVDARCRLPLGDDRGNGGLRALDAAHDAA